MESRYDISLPFLAEISQRQRQNLVIQAGTYIFYDSGTDGYHDGGGSEIACGLDCRYERQCKAQDEQHRAGSPLAHGFGHEPVQVVDSYILKRRHSGVPCNELVLHLIDIEQDLQYRDKQRERENVEQGRQYVKYHGPAQIALVRTSETF